MALRDFSVTPFNGSAGTTGTASIPATAQVGDIAVIATYVKNNVGISASGYRPMPKPLYIPAGIGGEFRPIWRRLTAAGAATVTVNFSGTAAQASVFCGIWSGRSTDPMPFDFFTAIHDALVRLPSALGGLASAGADVGYMFNEFEGDTNLTVTGFTEKINDTIGNNLYVADNVSAGPILARSSTSSVNTAFWSNLFSIRSASTPAPPIQGPFGIGYDATATGEYSKSITVEDAVPVGATVMVNSVALTTFPITVVDSKGNTYTQRGSLETTAGSNNSTVALYSSKLTTALAPGDTITVTRSNNNTANLLGIRAAYFLGVDSVRGTGVSGEGLTGAVSGSPTTLSLPAITTVAGDLVYALFVVNNNPTITPGTNFAQTINDFVSYTNTVPTTTTRSLYGDMIYATGTSVTPSAVSTNNQSTARTWGGIAVALVPAVTGSNQTIAVPTATETDSALTIGVYYKRFKSIPIAGESDSALTVGISRTPPAVAQATETNSVLTIGTYYKRYLAVPIASEVDTAIPPGFFYHRYIPVSVATESDAAIEPGSYTHRYITPVIAVESSEALAVGSVRVPPAAEIATEIDTTGLAIGVYPHHYVDVETANEVDTAIPPGLFGHKYIPVSTVVESDSAEEVGVYAHHYVPAEIADELDSAVLIGLSRASIVEIAEETDEALPLSIIRLIPAEIAVEVDAAMHVGISYPVRSGDYEFIFSPMLSNWKTGDVTAGNWSTGSATSGNWSAGAPSGDKDFRVGTETRGNWNTGSPEGNWDADGPDGSEEFNFGEVTE